MLKIPGQENVLAGKNRSRDMNGIVRHDFRKDSSLNVSLG
jgi:hypothetical protein